MKNFSSQLNNALKANEKRPVWLLQLDLVSASGAMTFHIADQPITLWGQSWKPLALGWGVIDRYFDPSESEIKVADVTVRLGNTPGALGAGTNNISWYFREYDLARSKAALYLWLDTAGLTPPSGQSQNDLITILTGTPELSSEVKPAVCSLDIVNRDGEYGENDCIWGDLLRGQYTKNQWGSLPARLVGKWKPIVFGSGVLCEASLLSAPERVGAVTGPDSLFDPLLGSSIINMTFPKGGEINDTSPYPAPCDIYIGDWRFTVQSDPVKLITGEWSYTVYTNNSTALYYVPTPLKGSTPIFTIASGLLWPKSSDTDHGPYASSEPAFGSPYQLYHGSGDSGSAKDGSHPGFSGRAINNVYIDGVEVASTDIEKDHSFGIVWLRSDKNSADGKVGNPDFLRVKWTRVDSGFSTGDQWLRPNQLTAAYPYGYQAEANPCILGDFAIPASGGGAPVSTQLGLANTIQYPGLGARVAAVRFVMRYTGLETSAGLFNLRIFDRDYSFNSSELDDGSGIFGQGWWVVKDQKGAQFEIWPNNNGFPVNATSPQKRFWDIYELSRDLSVDALAHIKANNGFRDSMRAWMSGTVWPNVNSMIILSCELEIQFEPVSSILNRPRVTALVSGPSSKAGEILQEVIPSGDIGAGFGDAALPDLKIHVGRQQSVCRFVRSVLRESNTEIKKNFNTGKWDLLKKSDIRDNANPPPPTGSVAVINQDDLLADANGLPVISRLRSAPDKVINEVTVRYVDSAGKHDSVTLRDQESIEKYSIRRYDMEMASAVSRSAAEKRALDILNANADVNDYYSLSFPLGETLRLEPNDILTVSAAMDSLFSTKMRVVSVEINPGDIANGRVGLVTINAQRYRRSTAGFGQTPFGFGAFGLGIITGN